MGIVFRQSVKSSIVIAFGALLGAALNYIYPFALSKAEIGLFTTVIYAGGILQLVAIMGMASVLAVFTQRYAATDEKRKALIGVSVMATVAGTLVITMLMALFKDKIVEGYQPSDQHYVNEFFYWVPVLILLWGFMTLMECYLQSQVKVAKSSFIKEVLLRMLNVVLIALLFYKVISFSTFVIGSILVHVVPVLLMIAVASKTGGFGISFGINAFSKTEYREIAHFAWYHILLIVSLNVMGYLDPILLGRLDKSGLETMAPYRIAVMVVALMVIPYRAMSAASYATLNQAYIDGDIPKLRSLFTRAGTNIFIVAVGLFVLVACNLDNILDLAKFPPGYGMIKPITIILMIGKLADMATGLNNDLISISKYYKFNFRVAILLVIMVIAFDYLLIPAYGAYGAAWGTTIALVLFSLLKIIFLWKKMQLHPFNRGTVMTVLAGIVGIAAGFYLPFFGNALMDFAIRSVVIIAIYLALLLLLKASNDLSTFLKGISTSLNRS